MHPSSVGRDRSLVHRIQWKPRRSVASPAGISQNALLHGKREDIRALWVAAAPLNNFNRLHQIEKEEPAGVLDLFAQRRRKSPPPRSTFQFAHHVRLQPQHAW